MKFRLVKLKGLSGKRATVYSVILNDEGQTLFDRFIVENKINFPAEIADLRYQIQTMAHKTGAREQFFERPEGKRDQNVWDLRDRPRKKLRLYCLWYPNVAIVLGGGGVKPKNIRSFQENPKLNLENDLMRKVCDAIDQRIRDKELRWSSDGTELVGEPQYFVFDDEETNEEE